MPFLAYWSIFYAFRNPLSCPACLQNTRDTTGKIGCDYLSCTLKKTILVFKQDSMYLKVFNFTSSRIREGKIKIKCLPLATTTCTWSSLPCLHREVIPVLWGNFQTIVSPKTILGTIIEKHVMLCIFVILFLMCKWHEIHCWSEI